jgi:hypothetical protein|tara:strand:- start:10592 stop:10885 length:294 start_codon:yes stop_codon:yes gene_type:complete
MNSNTLVFKITKKNDFLKLDFNTDVKNFIADLTDINKEVYELLIDKFIKFGEIIYANKGSFVIVSNISFDENLNIVPTLQEAYDFIDMEEIERQLNI